MQEKDPCVFAYSQRFRVPGSDTVKERRGFIALGKLHDYSEQVVFRHEQTLSKPKSDRLNLLKATRAHFGQVFMLYSDPAGSVEKILYEASGAADVTFFRNRDEVPQMTQLQRATPWVDDAAGGCAPEEPELRKVESRHGVAIACRYRGLQ